MKPAQSAGSQVGSKTTIFTVTVQFGDCGPAGTVFFPNFSRWMDAASNHFFVQCGLPPWRDMAEMPGVIGAPVLEVHTKFIKSVTYGETIEVHTEVEEWRTKVFVHRHRVMRGNELICDSRETRVLCVLDDAGRMKAVPVPEFVRSQCQHSGSPNT